MVNAKFAGCENNVGSVSVLPKVDLTKVDVMKTEIHVQWKYEADGRSKRSVADGKYAVGVQIKYKKESDKEYLSYPEDGSKLTAEKVKFCRKFHV